MEIDSPERAGVWTGRRRARVACSKLYPSASSLGSLNAGPKNEIPTGRLSPVKPAGTMRSGKPVRFAMSVAARPVPARSVAGDAGAAAVVAIRPGLRDDVGYTIASSL